MADHDATPDPTLHALAEAFAIATEYWDWQGRHVTVAPATLVAVLAALGVDAGTPEAAAAALAAQEVAPWRRVLPACRALREGEPATVAVHVPEGGTLDLWLELEAGDRRDLPLPPQSGATRQVDGRPVVELEVALPVDLPLGYHRLCARTGSAPSAMTLIVTPRRLELPARLAGQGWGVAAQLYSVRSAQSWGVGDLADLEDLAVWAAAEHGADYVLVNPLHAAEPVAPLEPSPYLPTTRRFTNPLYLRVERIPEYAAADEDVRRRVDALRAEAAPAVDGGGPAPIDRDRSWTAKRAALELVFDVPRTPGRELAFQAYRRREGRGLQDFATWAVLSEQLGATVDGWPERYRHPSSPAVQEFAAEHARAVELQCWLQWQLDEQLAAAQQAGLRAGMALGVMHDLAVGVHPAGADAWSLQDDYARGITVGAPPDPYNQNGQNWSQPPWRPDRLAETAYAPFRAMVSTILRHAGGIRVDHVIGLFRLWWIPAGLGPTEGTYVRYDHEAMIGILALEAHRAEALVVGEDLGTVEPWVRDHLSARGILGTSILWFEFDWEGDGKPLPPQRWRELCLASVTTHDLPPTAAYLAGDHVRLRDRLGVLTRPLEEELAAATEERRAWSEALVRTGLMTEGAGEEEMIEALHRFLTLTPARLLCVALTDLVGDRQAQNQPGTTDEYPNWRVPLTGPTGEPLSLEDVLASPRAAALAAVFEG
ncbi:4-alpha-glucanotransferase [Microlunatus capsulatus]|uniref:4-alpha-glucanotransferase n=1 Tax=Microlunatus capsulatus TaxID=99117 RepID=A0ABS4ZCR4_9ACTN|nr:4-alpha-glucanotransferase [Microlunatus capsulatus]MBP2418545.1 4-alpha-glucanotransferase [Microlunatus capsulatus]